MGRWEPDASGRLRQAAMDLYVERGYENTTVADIADRAGLTARTFFRYFVDKREVLFAGSVQLQEAMAAALDGAPAPAAPFDAIAAALDASAVWLDGDRAYAARRQSVIAANGELRERELIKMASLAEALTEGLRRRGVPEPDASLAAEAGIAVLRIAFHRWVSEAQDQHPAQDRSLALVMSECLQQLRALTAQS